MTGAKSRIEIFDSNLVSITASFVYMRQVPVHSKWSFDNVRKVNLLFVALFSGSLTIITMQKTKLDPKVPRGV